MEKEKQRFEMAAVVVHIMWRFLYNTDDFGALAFESGRYGLTRCLAGLTWRFFPLYQPLEAMEFPFHVAEPDSIF